MGGLRRLIFAVAIAIGAAALGAVPAAAAGPTLYVNGTTGKDTNPCTEAATPCKTITAALLKGEALEGTPTIEVSAGAYKEDLDLGTPSDSGVIINGSGDATEVVGVTGGPALKLEEPSGMVTLSNLSIITPSGDGEAGVELAGNLTLNDVAIRMRDASEEPGIKSEEFGSITINGGGVFMEAGTEGVAIGAEFTPLTINEAEVAVTGGPKAGGIADDGGALSVSNTTVSLGANTETAAIAGGLAPVSISNVQVLQGGKGGQAHAIEDFLGTPATISDVKITMSNPADTAAAIVQALGTASFGHIEVAGAWLGPVFQSFEGGNATFTDSRLVENAGSKEPAVLYGGFDEAPGLVLQRSVVQAPPTVPAALESIDGNVTIDSSEVLGGGYGVLFDQSAGKERALTIAASTIDAATPGLADPTATGVFVLSGLGPTVSHAKALIEGSIVFEGALVEHGAGSTAQLACRYSNVPSQTQAETSSAGSIACGAGSEGNTSATPESLFATPITSYALSPLSSAVDAVPSAAIALPFGLTPSATDLAGNPRSEGIDCVQLQDEGALELQGRSVACPPAPGPAPAGTAKPLAGIISALSISPSSFYPAPSGATISRASKKKYGAKITYRDSQAATTTFTVLRESAGRREGRSCKRPSPSNKHGKRCTILTALGGFTHVDKAGAQSLHFSGRLHGHKLRAGAYRLQAVAHDAAGNGAAVSRGFSVK